MTFGVVIVVGVVVVDDGVIAERSLPTCLDFTLKVCETVGRVAVLLPAATVGVATDPSAVLICVFSGSVVSAPVL